MQNEQEDRGGTQGFPLKPVLALLTSMVALALGTSLAKQLFPLIGAQGTTTLRLGFSALVLLLATRTWRHRLPRQDWWVVLRYGVTLGVMNLMFYMAIRTIPFGVAVAIEFCGPLAVALFSSRRRIDYLWIACAVAGLLLLLPSGEQRAPWTGGGAVCLAAATCWAGYIIFGKRTQHLHAGRTVALGVATGALVVAPVGLVHAGASLFAPQVLLVGLGAAVLSSAIPMFLEMKALRGAAGRYLRGDDQSGAGPDGDDRVRDAGRVADLGTVGSHRADGGGCHGQCADRTAAVRSPDPGKRGYIAAGIEPR